MVCRAMMAMPCYPNRVKCKGQGLTFGYIDLPIISTIDTRRAGPGLPPVNLVLFNSSAYRGPIVCFIKPRRQVTDANAALGSARCAHDLKFAWTFSFRLLQ